MSWALGGTTIGPDANKNADVGHVVLQRRPSAPGDREGATIDAVCQRDWPSMPSYDPARW
jgi:hypothetical protein